MTILCKEDKNMIKIIEELEPETSNQILKEYEEKYGISSDIFYKVFKLVEDYQNNFDLIDWVYNYEINCIARKKE